MPASSLNFQPTKIKSGSVGYLWVNVPAPAAGACATLTANAAGVLTPDSTLYPNAKHLGMTRAGAMATIKPSFESFFADEFSSPFKTYMNALDGSIEAELLQGFDMPLLKIVSAGFGTFTAATGYDEISFGIGVQAYTGVLLLFPTEADPTKYMCVHLYQAFNEAGIDHLGGARKDMSGLKVKFRGLDVTSRASADTLGKMWQIT